MSNFWKRETGKLLTSIGMSCILFGIIFALIYRDLWVLLESVFGVIVLSFGVFLKEKGEVSPG